VSASLKGGVCPRGKPNAPTPEAVLTRILLVTGKGGVGKTSVAAATAVRASVAGARVLVTSTDPAHSLADCLAHPLSDTPVPITCPPAGVGRVRPAPRGHLVAQQIDAQARLERHWGAVRGYLTTVLATGGLDEVRAEELVLLPGLDELFSLIDLRHHATSGEYDLIVVDCAPTAETLRLLALPDALRWYADRLLGAGRRVARLARPLGLHRGPEGRGMPIPGDEVFDTVEEVHADLAAVHTLLQDGERTSVRLVTNPERLAVAEAMRTATSLGLFGYAIDAVIANRALPREVRDPYLLRWKERHEEHLETLRSAFGDLPVLEAPLLRDEPIGVAALAGLADAIYGRRDATSVLHRSPPFELRREGDDHLLRLVLPFATSDDLELSRRGEELHLKVAGVRRTLALPASLRSADVVAAGLRDGALTVRFRVPSDLGVT
jgi:arsenite/tail-anchored protein-transporting ATPase